MPTALQNTLVDSVRRDLMKRIFGLAAGASFMPSMLSSPAFAAARGSAVPDQKAVQVSDHVYVLYARGGFPSKENQGFLPMSASLKQPKARW